MTEGHIPFKKLSAFYDEEFFLADEKENIIHHRNTCITCRTEYAQLETTVSCCASLKKYIVCDSDFTVRTMKAIRIRRRRRLLKKYIPAAVAATVVLAGGFALMPSFTAVNQQPYAVSSAAPSVGGDTMERIMEVIDSGSGSILSVSDDFIECSVSCASAESFMRRLADENLSCERIPGSMVYENSVRNPMIHQVGTLSGSSEKYSIIESVRFRIYR